MKKQPNIQTFSDNQLISEYCRTKDNYFAGLLFKRYTSFVFLIGMTYLKNEEKTKDAVMQIFEKLLDDLLKHEISNFKSWLHTVTRNHCLMQLRSEQRLQKKQLEFEKDYATFMENETDLHQIDEPNDNEKKYQNLKAAINELKDEQCQCIKLFYLQEKSYKEIVEQTGLDIKKVKSFIQNGKRNLKILLTKKTKS